MKILVDSSTSEVLGSYREPLGFSVSGRFLVDVSSDIQPYSTDLTDLLNTKQSAVIAAHPSLPNSVFDEFLDVSKISSSLSTRVIIGPKKRTTILPGGVLFTSSITPPGPVTTVFLHYSCYSLYRDIGTAPNPSASRLLVDYDPNSGSVPFSNSMVTASITTSVGVFSFTPTPDVEFASSVPSPFRISFTNNTERPMTMSDWALLYG